MSLDIIQVIQFAFQRFFLIQPETNPGDTRFFYLLLISSPSYLCSLHTSCYTGIIFIITYCTFLVSDPVDKPTLYTKIHFTFTYMAWTHALLFAGKQPRRKRLRRLHFVKTGVSRTREYSANWLESWCRIFYVGCQFVLWDFCNLEVNVTRWYLQVLLSDLCISWKGTKWSTWILYL